MAVAAKKKDLLEWAEKDNRRFLNVVYRVGNLDRTIKYYTECFGMNLWRKRDFPEEKYSDAFLGYNSEDSHLAVQLIYNYGVDKIEIGTGFGHFCIATEDLSKFIERIVENGGTMTSPPSFFASRAAINDFALDPDGYLFELIQRPATPEPFCHVMLYVGDINRSIKFYEQALAKGLLNKTEMPEVEHTVVSVGYGEEYETFVLELAYRYGVTEYDNGSGYVNVVIGTDDVHKTAESVNLAVEEHGGEITQLPGSVPGSNTKTTTFLDPDGWKTVLIDNKDFQKELEAI